MRSGFEPRKRGKGESSSRPQKAENKPQRKENEHLLGSQFSTLTYHSPKRKKEGAGA